MANSREYDVRNYGSIGTLDDVPAYQACIDAMPEHGGILPIQGSRPNFETSLIINKPVNFIGVGRTDSSGRYGGTTIQTSNPAVTPIIVKSSAVTLEKFGMVNSSNNVTAGAGIQIDISQPRSTDAFGPGVAGQPNGGSFDIDKVAVFGYFNGIHVKNGIEYCISNWQVEAAKNYGLLLEHELLPDGGDQTITGGQLVASRYDGATAIKILSGGGPKITNVKVNARTEQYAYLYGIDVDIQQSVDLMISNCSLESYRQSAINVRPSNVFYGLAVSNNQFYASVCQGPVINLEGIKGFVIGPNQFGTSANSNTAVRVKDCTAGYVAKQSLMFYQGDPIADRRVGMKRINSPSVEFEGVAGTADFG